MPLSKKQLQDVCLVNNQTYKKCRYLAVEDDNMFMNSRYYCLKKSRRRAEIDVDLNDFIRDTRKKGKDPYKENIPLGDNCAGYPIFKYIEQGYDVKP